MYHGVNNEAAAHLTIFFPVAQSLNKGKMLLGNSFFADKGFLFRTDYPQFSIFVLLL